MPSSESKRRRRPSLKRRIGTLRGDDSLAAVNWMLRGLGQLALEVDGDRDLSPRERRAELVKIAGAMAKLRDLDRLYRAELTVRESQAWNDVRRPGPEMVPAAPGITGRRGRPPARAIDGPSKRGRPPRGGT